MLVYLTDPLLTPNWIKVDTTLEHVFGNKEGPRQFSLYRDESRDIRHGVYHPIDYVSHDVRIIVGEFDSLRHLADMPDNSEVVKELDTDGDTSIIKVTFPTLDQKKDKYEYDDYTKKVFDRLSNDDRILFCYITTSGKGIRFGFKLDARLNNDLEYISNYYFYGKEFLKHDDENRFGIETNSSNTGTFYELCTISTLYWLLPQTNDWSVKIPVDVRKL